MKTAQLITTLLMISLFACKSGAQQTSDSEEKKQSTEVPTQPLKRMWRAELIASENVTIPFNFELDGKDGNYIATFKNADERLVTPNVIVKGDSIFIPGHVFASEFRGKITDENTIEGVFEKLDTKNPYLIPFKAYAEQNYRIVENCKEVMFDFSGKWEVNFVNEGDTTKAIGIFNQKYTRITGTFLTATGDYRYLEGEVSGKEMQVSTFDGSHLFLFKASAQEDGTIKGDFWSGKNWYESWVGVKNEKASLPSPDELTYINGRYGEFNFEFPDAEGNMMALADRQFANKVTLVQITGTWCPNCMDETRYLVELKKRYPELEIVAVAFEKFDGEKLKNHLDTYKSKLGITYPILVGGKADKNSASESFPLLSGISSFPTLLIVDKKKKIRNIHTGFSGPGTGETYLKFTKSFEEKLNILLAE